jgi:hypothetical protein
MKLKTSLNIKYIFIEIIFDKRAFNSKVNFFVINWILREIFYICKNDFNKNKIDKIFQSLTCWEIHESC